MAGVRFYPAQRLARAKRKFDIFMDQPLKQLVHVRDQRIHVEYRGLQRLPPAERQHLARERSGAVRSLANLLAAAEKRVFHRKPLDDEFRVTLDYGQQVIEIVCDTAGQASESFHLLRLPKFFLELALLRFVFLKRAAHLIERAREVRDFVAAAGLDRKRKIAALQGLNALIEIRKRTRERVGN